MLLLVVVIPGYEVVKELVLLDMLFGGTGRA